MSTRYYHFFGLPLVLIVSIPFAAFAAFTTSIAFFVLFIRLLIVYFDLGIALIHSALRPLPPSPPSPSTTKKDPILLHSQPPTPGHETAKPRRRRSSLVGTATPPQNGPHASSTQNTMTKTASFASLVGTGTANRDYEGVGGWRLATSDDDEEALWLNLNSRLELPVTSSPASRRHKRSASSTSQSLRSSPEMGRSPLLMRARTPGTASPEGYFSLQPLGGGGERGGSREAVNPAAGISRVSFDDKVRGSAVSSTESLGVKVVPKGHPRSLY